MTAKDSEYYGERERAERAAAESAGCPEAKRAHLELAQFYAKLVSDGGPHKVDPSRSRKD